MDSENSRSRQRKHKTPGKQHKRPISTDSIPKAKRVKGRKKKETFQTYISKTLSNQQQSKANPNEISSDAMSVMNSMMEAMFQRIAMEASKLAKINNKKTISAREIETAVKLIFPGKLAGCAVAEGARALNRMK